MTPAIEDEVKRRFDLLMLNVERHDPFFAENNTVHFLHILAVCGWQFSYRPWWVDDEYVKPLVQSNAEIDQELNDFLAMLHIEWTASKVKGQYLAGPQHQSLSHIKV